MQNDNHTTNGASCACGSPLSLEAAMKGADAIRQSLIQNNDSDEAKSWLPPGTMQGFLAFGVTAVVVSPLRNIILRRAAAAASSRIKMNNHTETTPNSSQPPSLTSFVNLIDLIVTPLMAVVAAQVGLVVGTWFGSSYYLQRVLLDHDDNDAELLLPSMTTTTPLRNDDHNIIDTTIPPGKTTKTKMTTPCQSLLQVVYTTSHNSIGTGQHHSSARAGIDDTSFSAPSPPPTPIAPPQLYPSWDPRQLTIQSLYKAIQHCQQQQQQQQQQRKQLLRPIPDVSNE